MARVACFPSGVLAKTLVQWRSMEGHWDQRLVAADRHPAVRRGQTKRWWHCWSKSLKAADKSVTKVMARVEQIIDERTESKCRQMHVEDDAKFEEMKQDIKTADGLDAAGGAEAQQGLRHVGGFDSPERS
mmetsp:Transcript_90602/g.233845  ORF Transcript_90602/g.233845 Transcript_90602/m.233845 type:complete len:130 (+) Transcript_90602:55-444(+)